MSAIQTSRHRNGLAYTVGIVRHMQEAKKVPPIDKQELPKPSEEDLNRMASLAARGLPIGRIIR